MKDIPLKTSNDAARKDSPQGQPAADHREGEAAPEGGGPGKGNGKAKGRGNGGAHPPRWLRLAIEAALGILAGLVLLGGIVLWRLSAGPVQVDFLTPVLESALSGGEEDFTVDIGETVLIWEGWPHNINLRARQVTVLDGQGQPLVLLPAVAVTLSLRALVQGTVAPTYVELLDGILILERDAQGVIQFGSAGPEGQPQQQGTGLVLRALLDEILSPPDPDQRLSFLTAVRIRDGRLVVRDRVLGAEWYASDLTLEIRRDPVGLAGELALTLDLPGSPASGEAAFTYNRETGLIDAASSFTDLRPGAVASVLTSLEPLKGLEMSLDGSISGTLDTSGRLDAASFEIAGGAGLLTLPDRLPSPQVLRDLSIRGTFDGPERRVELERAELRFGSDEAPGPALALEGGVKLERPDGASEIEARARLIEFPMAELDQYWPRGLGENAREWIVENVTSGQVEDASLDLAVILPAGLGLAAPAEAQAPDEAPQADATPEPSSEPDPEPIVERMGGTLAYRDMEVHFLRPIPPITGIKGEATFDEAGMYFRIEGGRQGGIALGASEVAITGFDVVGAEIMDIRFPAEGSLPEVLGLLNHERLALLDKLGIDPATTGGQAKAQVRFNFPLLEDLDFDQVSVSTEGTVRDGAVKQLLLGQDVTEGQLALSLTQDGMTVRGPLKLGGVPLEMEWQEFFRDDAPQTSLYEVSVPSMNQVERERFGFDVLEGLTGPVSASVMATSLPDGSNEIMVALNLLSAGLTFPEIYWAKQPGEPGSAKFTLMLQDGRPQELRHLEAEAEGMTVSGQARFDQAGEALARLELDRLDFGINRLRDVTLVPLGEGWTVGIGGGVLNAAPFVARAEKEEEGEQAEKTAEPPLQLSARNLQRVYFAEDRYLDDVTIGLDRDSEDWRLIQLRAQVPGRYSASQPASGQGEAAIAPALVGVELSYRPDEAGGHVLSGSTADLGAVLKALDLFDTMEGGELRLTGHRPPEGPLAGQIEVAEFRMIDAPVLARLLLVASLTGIVEGLSSSGLAFDRMTGDFTLASGLFKTELLRAYGTSLGITTNGRVDIGENKLDMKGTIVPAYGLNSILNNIPVIGTFLTGGEGEGFVAFTYTMTGPIEDPKISVNPLSALAPGFLRGIFSGEGTNEKPTLFPEGVQR